MSTNWSNYHPNYDYELKHIAKNKTLQALLEKERESLDKDEATAAFNSVLTLRLTHRINTLKRTTERLESHIIILQRFFKEIKAPYQNYQNDLQANITLLEDRAKAWQAEMDKCVLIKPEGEERKPRKWHLDKQDIALELYKPQVNYDAYLSSHPESAKITQPLNIPTFYNRAEFRYADDNTVIKERFVIYWEFKKNDISQLADISADSFRYTMRPIGFGMTDGNGNLRQCTPISYTVTTDTHEATLASEWPLGMGQDFYKKNLIVNDSDIFDPEKAYELSKKGDDKGYKAYSKQTNDQFNARIHYGFMLYPLDRGPFKTKNLNELSTLAAPIYPGSSDVVYKGYVDEYDKVIPLHCTLPEWNYRLNEKLKDLNELIEAFNIVASPHHQKLRLIERLQTYLSIQQAHSHDADNASNTHNKNQLENALDELHDGISVRLETPTTDRQMMWSFADLKQDIDDAADELWQVLKSEALRAEIEAYLKHVGEKEKNNGEMPPGPYMDFEPNWDEIFITIAQCYAALSASNSVANKVWEDDVKHGIDKLATLEGMDQFIDEIKLDWNETVADSDEADLKYANEQAINLSSELTQNKVDTEGLLATILEYSTAGLKDYQEGIKPMLDVFIPTPGAPTILQVVLSCFDTPIMKHLLNKVNNVPKNTTYHIRFSIGTIISYRFFGIKATRMEIFRGFIILNGTANPFKHSANARTLLRESFEGLDSDTSRTVNNFYKRFDNPKAAFAKSIFTVFNACLTIQNIVAGSANNEMSATRKIMEVTVGLGNLGVSAGALVILTRRMRSMPKSSYTLLGDQLDRVAGLLGVVVGTLALWDAVAYTDKGESGKATRKYIEAAGGLSLSIGYIIRKKIGEKLVTSVAKAFAREGAAFATAAAATGATFNPYVGGVLLITGTTINIGLLVYDLTDIAGSIEGMFYRAPTKRAIEIWDTFIEHPVLPLKLKKEQFHDNSELRQRVEKLYDPEPQKTYMDKSLQYGMEYLTIKPVEEVSELVINHTGPFDSGVDWGDLSWRAIIPLYDMQYTAEQIEDLVEMPEILETNNQIATVKDIIEYYEQAKKQNPEDLHIEAVNDKLEYENYSNVLMQLQAGTFVPDPAANYYEAERWQHPHFQLVATEQA